MKPFRLENYGEQGHPLQTVSICENQQHPHSWIVFVHGGLWRDPRQDASMGHALLSDLPASVASVNYRLTPEVQHPLHLHDIQLAMAYLERNYAIRHLVIVGHSAGATLTYQWGKADVSIGVEGIYDLEDLVFEYPEYTSAIEDAFGNDRRVWKGAQPQAPARKSIIVHSDQDELVSWRQPNAFHQKIGGHVVKVSGRHDQVLYDPELKHLLRRQVEGASATATATTSS